MCQAVSCQRWLHQYWFSAQYALLMNKYFWKWCYMTLKARSSKGYNFYLDLSLSLSRHSYGIQSPYCQEAQSIPHGHGNGPRGRPWGCPEDAQHQQWTGEWTRVPSDDSNPWLLSLLAETSDITEQRQAIPTVLCPDSRLTELVSRRNDCLYTIWGKLLCSHRNWKSILKC